MRLDKRTERKITKMALWIGILLPILPGILAMLIGYGGLPPTAKDWSQLLLYYLGFAFAMFVVARWILQWICSGFRLDALIGLPTIAERKFVEEAEVPPGRGLIYFYRPWMNFRIAAAPVLYVDKERIAVIRAGTYCPYFSSPGGRAIYVWKSPASLALDVIAGQRYYVQILPEGLHFVARSVSAKEGLAEIRYCKKTG